MGIIQKQSIRSTIVILIGFAIGGINLLFLAPKILTTEELGLTRMLVDTGTTLGMLCTLGALPVIYKFFPFYNSYLPPHKNDLPYLTFLACMIGLLIVGITGYFCKHLIFQKYGANSPLFVEYSYLMYPIMVCLLLFCWLEVFSNSFKKGVVSNAMRETVARIIFTVLLALIAFKLIDRHWFMVLYSLSYLIPAIVLFIMLRKTGMFYFNTTISPLTHRLKGKMITFGFFIFGAQFLNLLSRTVDSFIISSKSEKGLTDVAIYSIATYMVMFMEVPQRSMNAITVPVLAESWKNKDIKNIEHVYEKSVTNLLLIGLGILSLLWLNLHNVTTYLGKEYAGIEKIILLMGLAKLIDLGTGTNSQIIGTSNYWRVDFTTNVVYTILALPLNYFLISLHGLPGAAYALLISLTLYNAVRFIFLWYKFKLQPYTIKHLLSIVTAVIVAVLVYFIPTIEFSTNQLSTEYIKYINIISDVVIRSFVFVTLFATLAYYLKLSEELNVMVLKYAKKLKKD